MTREKKYTIEFLYGSYSGTEIIYADENADPIAIMWGNFKRHDYLSLSMACQQAKVVKIEDIGDDD